MSKEENEVRLQHFFNASINFFYSNIMKDCFWILLTTIHLVFFSSVYGHAAFMLTKNCEKQLALGESVMNGKMKLDTTRTVTVLRNGTLLTSGSNYNPGEVLTVGVSAFSYELVIEARGL